MPWQALIGSALAFVGVAFVIVTFSTLIVRRLIRPLAMRLNGWQRIGFVASVVWFA
jgi:hypothetical protein